MTAKLFIEAQLSIRRLKWKRLTESDVTCLVAETKFMHYSIEKDSFLDEPPWELASWGLHDGPDTDLTRHQTQAEAKAKAQEHWACQAAKIITEIIETR